MFKTIVAHTITTLAATASLTLVMAGTAAAGNTTSKGQGVKCSWVLVSSVNGVNTYQQICRKGV